MPDQPAIAVLLTTYNRTELALRTIKGMMDNFHYDGPWWWIIADDGSNDGHMGRLREACGDRFKDAYNSERRGVGHGMNWGIKRAEELGASIIAFSEDDWELTSSFNADPHVRLLMNHDDIGMIRLGYLSYGPKGTIISREGKLWFKMEPYLPFQYTYAGHFALKHARFHQSYGNFKEGIAPGACELYMCARVNANPNGPAIVWCMDYGWQAPWGHIGSISLADIAPEA